MMWPKKKEAPVKPPRRFQIRREVMAGLAAAGGLRYRYYCLYEYDHDRRKWEYILGTMRDTAEQVEKDLYWRFEYPDGAVKEFELLDETYLREKRKGNYYGND